MFDMIVKMIKKLSLKYYWIIVPYGATSLLFMALLIGLTEGIAKPESESFEIRELLKQAAQEAEYIKSPVLFSTQSSRLKALSEVALAQIKGGDQSGSETTLRRILEIVDSLEDPQPEEPNRGYWQQWKALLYVKIALAEADAGEMAASKLNLQKSLQIARGLPDGEKKISALERAALAQIRIKDWESAKETALKINETIDSIKSPAGPSTKVHKVRVAMEMATAYEEYRNKAMANALIYESLGEISSIKDNFSKADAYRAVASVQARMGDPAATYSILDKVFLARNSMKGSSSYKNEYYKVNSLLEIAESQHYGGDPINASLSLQRAMDLANKIKTADSHSSLKSAALRDIATTSAKMGNTKLAMQAEKDITDESYQGVSLPYIVEALVKSGHLDNALRIANEAETNKIGNKDSLLTRIVYAQLDLKDEKGALETSNLIAFFTNPELVRSIGMARMRVLGIEDGLLWAKNQPSPRQKTYALLGIVDGIFRSQNDRVSEQSITAD